MNPLVSICIPAYQQPEMLEKCLQSVAVQSYQQIEVILSDDTPGNAVKIIVDRFSGRLNISYYKNEKPLGSPANWNAALKDAKGEYVLLLHHDDAFASETSLAEFLNPFLDDSTVDFVFGRNPSIERIARGKPFSPDFFQLYYKEPERFLVGNFIGAPSNVMLKASVLEYYHPTYKWIVDFEFYIRLFKKKRKFFYVDKVLVEIGLHEGQVTNDCIDNPDVLLYENISFAIENKLRIRNYKLYDFYWRLLRNAGVKSIDQLTRLQIKEEEIPSFIKRMINMQRWVPASLLHQGILSKFLMTLNYTVYRFA